MVIKLLMSSMYGKTIIKPVETYTIVKDNRDNTATVAVTVGWLHEHT